MQSTLVQTQTFSTNINQRAIVSLLIFLIVNKIIKKFVTYYVNCRTFDGSTLSSKVNSNNYKVMLRTK